MYPALLVRNVLSEAVHYSDNVSGADNQQERPRVQSRPGQSDRASGVLDGVKDAGNPQRLYAKLVLSQTGGGMR